MQRVTWILSNKSHKQRKEKGPLCPSFVPHSLAKTGVKGVKKRTQGQAGRRSKEGPEKWEHLEMAAQNLVDNQLHALHLCWKYI